MHGALIRLILGGDELTWRLSVQPPPLFFTREGRRVCTHGGVHFFDVSRCGVSLLGSDVRREREGLDSLLHAPQPWPLVEYTEYSERAAVTRTRHECGTDAYFSSNLSLARLRATRGAQKGTPLTVGVGVMLMR